MFHAFCLFISSYLHVRFYNVCTYAYIHDSEHKRKLIHNVAPILRRYSYSVERRAPILMSISGLGSATVLREDPRKPNEVLQDRPVGPVPRRPTGAGIRSCILPINFKNAPPFITSRHPARLMVTDSPWQSRSDLARATASRMRHHFSYRPAKYDALLIALVGIPVFNSSKQGGDCKKRQKHYFGYICLCLCLCL